jgi:hypothetical protein
MRKSSYLLLCLVLVALTAIPASASPMGRPFKGSVAGEVAFLEVSFELCPSGGTFWGGLQTAGSAVGAGSHLGRTVMTSAHCTPIGDDITGGSMVLRAANGDEVHIEYAGAAPFPEEGTDVIVATTEGHIVGGTGRFEAATGEVEMIAHVVFAGFEAATWPASWHWTGWIRY